MATSNPYESPLADKEEPIFRSSLVGMHIGVAGLATVLVWTGLVVFVGAPLSQWEGSLPSIIGAPCLTAIVLAWFFSTGFRIQQRIIVAIGSGIAIGVAPGLVCTLHDWSNGTNFGFNPEGYTLVGVIGLGCAAASLMTGLIRGSLRKPAPQLQAEQTGS